MKKLVFALFLISGAAFSQDMNVVQGNFDFLKNQTEINIEFDYSNFTMMKENKPEAQYVAEHIVDLDKKAKGNGKIGKNNGLLPKSKSGRQNFYK